MKRILSGILAGLIACLLMVLVSAANKQEVDPDTKVISKETAVYKEIQYDTGYNDSYTVKARYSTYITYPGGSILLNPLTVAYSLDPRFADDGSMLCSTVYRSGTPLMRLASRYLTLGDLVFSGTGQGELYDSHATTEKHGIIPGWGFVKEYEDYDDIAVGVPLGRLWFDSKESAEKEYQELKNYDFNSTITFKAVRVVPPDFKMLELQNCVINATFRFSAVPVTINGGNYSGAPALQLIVPIDLIQNIQGSFLSI